MKEIDKGETLRAIENFEQFYIKKPLNGNRSHEGLPPATQEEVLTGRKVRMEKFFKTHPLFSGKEEITQKQKDRKERGWQG